MKKLSTYLKEDKQGKNLHLEHIEDDILNFGVVGARAAINFLQSLRDMLAGSTRSSLNMTVKWDGAPAIFAGIDPADGKFFVAKKSVFNATPLLYKTQQEINTDPKLPASLKPKFSIALAEFGKLGIKGVLQGDLMFTKEDLKTETIDGTKHTTFQPNTIVYAIPTGTPLDTKIKQSKIGVVWHTSYSGNSLSEMKASFGANITSLRKLNTVWMDDATYKDTSGTATFTATETAQVTAMLSSAGNQFRKISSAQLNTFNALQATFSGKLVGAGLKTYNNSKVREGTKVSNPKAHAVGYYAWVENKFNVEIAKLKTEKSRDALIVKRDASLQVVKRHEKLLEDITAFQGMVVDAKMMIVSKLDAVQQIAGTFIKTANGFKVTNPEGYVAIDRVSGNAVKLVDRMEFSYNNFTAIKAWDK
tara:strand:+ start:2149 stop:3402 length:1254 start_codon:yes stop_codon:yes gene_type:complete